MSNVGLSVTGRAVSRSGSRGSKPAAVRRRASQEEVRDAVRKAAQPIIPEVIKAPTVPPVRGDAQHQLETAFAVLTSYKPADVSGALHDEDPHHTGEMTYEQFQHAVERFGLKLNTSDIQALAKSYDMDHDGKVQYDEFFAKLVDKLSSKAAEAPPSAPDPVESMLAERIQNKFAQVRRAFRAIDRDHSGTISSEELKLVLKELGIDAKATEVRHIIDHMDSDHDGVIEYDEFNEQFGKLIHGDSSKNILDLMGSPEKREHKPLIGKADQTDLTTANNILKEKLANNFSQVRKAFRQFDEDHSGTITAGEFRLALRSFGIDLSDEDLNGMVAVFDTDGDGTVGYQEFNKYVSELLNPSEEVGGGMLGRIENSPTHDIHREARDTTIKGTAEDVEAMLVDKIKNKYNKVQHAFRSFDKDHSGSINADEFKAVLYTYGMATTEEELQRLVSKFDVDGDGTIRYDEFNETFGQVVNPGHEASAYGTGPHNAMPPPVEHAAAGAGGDAAPAAAAGAGADASGPEADAPAEQLYTDSASRPRTGASRAMSRASRRSGSPLKRKGAGRRYPELEEPAGAPLPSVRYGGTHRSRFRGERTSPSPSPVRRNPLGGLPGSGRHSYSSSRSPGKLSKDLLRRQVDAAAVVSAETVDTVRKAVAVGGGGLQGMFRAFRRVDSEKTGILSYREFADVLSAAGVKLDRSQVKALARAHSRGRHVDYSDFVKHYARLTHMSVSPVKMNATSTFRSGTASDTRAGNSLSKSTGALPALRPGTSSTSIVQSMVNAERGPREVVRNLVEAQWKDMLRVFRTFDDDRNGNVSVGDLHKVLAHFGSRVSKDDVRAITAKLDLGDGQIKYQDFVKAQLKRAALAGRGGRY